MGMPVAHVPAAVQSVQGGTANAYHYAPLYRPAPFSGIPSGWEFVEVRGVLNRPDLPISKRPHGVICYRRPLTADECQRFELQPVAWDGSEWIDAPDGAER